jgi:hypothetical protein
VDYKEKSRWFFSGFVAGSFVTLLEIIVVFGFIKYLSN